MLTRSNVIISQRKHVSNHCVVHLNLYNVACQLYLKTGEKYNKMF